MWKDGKRNGKGTLKLPNLEDINWEWKNDIPVQFR